MISHKTSPAVAIGIASVLALAVFIVDLRTSLGVAAAVPYIAVVVVTFWSPRRRDIYLSAGACSVLTLLGYYASPDGGEAWKDVYGRCSMLFAIWIVAVVKQNGLARITQGNKAMVTFSAAPGVIFQSKVAAELPGVIQGQVTIEAAASPLQVISSAPDAYPVRIFFPEGAPDKLRRPGGLASVTIYTDEGNPINLLARILQWISTWLDFVL